MQGTNVKTITQYCSVCKEHFEMEVVKQGSSKNVIWLKCPGCQGFLPHMPEDEDGEAKHPDVSGVRPGDLLLYVRW